MVNYLSRSCSPYQRLKSNVVSLPVASYRVIYCLAFLLYASEAVRPSNSNIQSLDKCINRAIFKIFGLNSNDCIQATRHFVNLPSLKVLIESRRLKFVNRLLNHKQCATLFLTNTVY